MYLRCQLLTILSICCLFPPCFKASNITDVHLSCPVEGGTLTFPWVYTLDPGETLIRIEWRKISPTTAPLLEVDSSGTPTQFEPRASTNGSAFLILTDVTAGDVGMYRCTITTMLSGTARLTEDTAEMGLTKPPDVTGVVVTANALTATTALVKLEEVPVNDICYKPLTWHIEHKLPFGSWVQAGSMQGSPHGNTTLSFNVTGLDTKGNYSFRVSAQNSVITSNHVLASNGTSIFIKGLFEAFISLPPLVAFECLALLAAIVMIAILVADKSGTCTHDMLKLLACVGPAVDAVLAVIVIIMVAVSHRNEQGFIIIVVLSAVAAGISIMAAIAGYLFQKCCNRANFPVITMALLLSMGLMVAIAGIVVSVLYEQEQVTKVAGLALGIVSIVLLVAAFIWFMYRLCCGNKQSSKDLPGPEVRQEDNEDL